MSALDTSIAAQVAKDADVALRMAWRINKRMINRQGRPVRRWFVSRERYMAILRYLDDWALRQGRMVRVGPNGGVLLGSVEIHSR